MDVRGWSLGSPFSGHLRRGHAGSLHPRGPRDHISGAPGRTGRRRDPVRTGRAARHFAGVCATMQLCLSPGGQRPPGDGCRKGATPIHGLTTWLRRPPGVGPSWWFSLSWSRYSPPSPSVWRSLPRGLWMCSRKEGAPRDLRRPQAAPAPPAARPRPFTGRAVGFRSDGCRYLLSCRSST